MRIILGGVLLMGVMTINAQEKIETTIGTDIVSQYIWRGQDLGSVSVQPTLAIGYKGLSLTGWGNIGLSDPADAKEFDLTLDYTIKGFNFGISNTMPTAQTISLRPTSAMTLE